MRQQSSRAHTTATLTATATELEWPVSKATYLYAHLYMVYIHLYKIIEGTSLV